MGRQGQAGRAVTVGDVLAVLELARAHLDAAAPVPRSWDAVIAEVQAVLLAQAAPPVSGGATPRTPAPGDSTGQHENT